MTDHQAAGNTPSELNSGPHAASETGARRPAGPWLRRALVLLWIPAAIPWLLMLIYWQQPDGLASVTVIPAFCWVCLGTQILGPMLLAWRRPVFYVALLGWMLFTYGYVGEWRSLLRSQWALPTPPAGAIRLRIVSVNTGSGKAFELQGLKRFEPDLILAQETPAAYQLPYVAQSLWGEAGYIVAGQDCSILARRPLKLKQAVPENARFQQAVWEPVPGTEIDVFSLRLTSVPVDVTFWESETRRTYRDVRKRHSRELAPLLDRIKPLDADRPLIVGGDFNCPAGDRVEWPLKQRLRDAFKIQGRGWGNTINDQLPFHRIDRIWVSRQLVPVNVTAERSKLSDHWIVVCDVFILPRVTEPQPGKGKSVETALGGMLARLRRAWVSSERRLDQWCKRLGGMLARLRRA